MQDGADDRADVPRSLLTNADLDRATAHVAVADPVMAALAARHGPYRPGARRRSHFTALARSIVYQQLSGTAARTIWTRLTDVIGTTPRPAAVLAADEEHLRGAGLSGAKAAAIRDLASKVADGTVPLAGISRLTDDEVVARLVSVRGIGRWTAEMFLIFQLRRPDVWPVDDLGVRKGFAAAYPERVDGELPTPRALAPAGDPFRPYRSAAAWYLWRAVDTVTP